MRPFDTFSFLQLLQNQWKSPKEIEAIQNRKLRRLVNHAYTHVPYYRQLFDSVGITPKSISGIQDIAKIPTTSRNRLMELPREQILARNIKTGDCRITKTSGCTRSALRILHRRSDLSLMNLGWARAYFAHGIKPWHHIAEFAAPQNAQNHRSWYEYLGLMQRIKLASSDHPDKWISELAKWKTHALTGYSSTLMLLARTLHDQNITDISPRAVFSCSELLDKNNQKFLRSVFNCNVVDLYGSEEARCIAWECDKCSGYHINSDMLIVEFLRDGKPVGNGEEGEIVITNLHSYAMPFIRYKQEDVGVPIEKKSACGRGLPLMSVIKGRLNDFIVLVDGQKISPQVFYYAIVPVKGVGQWRAVQEKIGELKIEIVPSSNFLNKKRLSKRKGKTKYKIDKNLQQVFGERLKIDIEFVDSIAHSPGKKYRSIISLLNNETL